MKVLLLIALAAFSLSSCCRKVDCARPMYSAIELRSFAAGEVDSIIVRSYERGSGFNTPLDSMSTAAQPGNGPDSTLVLRVGDGLNYNLDYTINLPRTGQEFRITDFGYGHETCNRCWLNGNESGNNYMNSYTRNDTRVNSEVIYLDR